MATLKEMLADGPVGEAMDLVRESEEKSPHEELRERVVAHTLDRQLGIKKTADDDEKVRTIGWRRVPRLSWKSFLIAFRMASPFLR